MSICIPTHALTHQIIKSLQVLAFDAALARSVEVVVVYDGTPVSEWAAEIAAVQKLNLKQIYMEKAGPAAARNLAARNASHKQLIFCDSDVLITREAVRLATKVPAGKLMVPRIEPIAQNNEVADFFSEYVFAPRHEDGYDYTVSAFWGMAKSDFEAIGGFDERFRHPAGEDFDFMRRWNESGRSIQFVKEAVVFHRNPTTVKDLLDRAHRYGRHGDLGTPAAAPENAVSSVTELAAPTWVDLVLFPLALVFGGIRRLSEIAESALTNLSLNARNRVRDSGFSWFAIPRILFEGPRLLLRLIGFTFALLTGRGAFRVHGNRKLTALWLAAWQIGKLKGKSKRKLTTQSEE